MASEFPRSPKLLKGALAVYEGQTPGTQPQQIIVFQYNPDQVRRTLARRAPPADASERGAAREDALRVPGPPVESISLSVYLDAADQLAEPSQNQGIVENGLHPALATLEMMLYPPTLRLQQNERLAQQGEVQLSPQELPLVLLVWGRSRVVPVMLSSFSVSEEAFDPELNPIRAKVDLGLRVLTYVELPAETLGRDAFLAYQRRKESLAGEYRNGRGEDRIRGLLPA